MKLSIVIVGVGGQGTLLASRVLGRLAMDAGADVKVSEVHGMSQRGGSVVTFLKMGDKISAPLVEEGEADYVLAFEQMEAYRALPYLKKGGTVIVNTQKIAPMPVVTGQAAYPDNLIVDLCEKAPGVIAVDAYALAVEAGEARSVNMVLMGVLCSKLGMEKEKFESAIVACVKPALREVNLRAFEAGYAAAE